MQDKQATAVQSYALTLSVNLDKGSLYDYIGHMIKTLRESKATLSALVELASHGEEVVITVHGKPKARLCPISDESPGENKAWGRRLKEARAVYSVGVHDTGNDVLDDVRGDRL